MVVKAQTNTKFPNQDSSGFLTFRLNDPHTGQLIPTANIQTATLRLVNKSDGAVINGRTGERPEDVVADKFVSAGIFEMMLDPEDNVIMATNEVPNEEIHVAIVTIVATTEKGAMTLKEEIELTVMNLPHA